jgi:hypothetical protein
MGRMKVTTLALVAALALAAGCRSQSAPNPAARWQRVDASAGPLEATQSACQNEAFVKSENVNQGDLGTKAAAGLYVECMKRHGWAPASGDAH